jgi:hypothetical protein
MYLKASTTEYSANAEMHTDAVQSVLEMGYSQDVIRNALRAIRNRDGKWFKFLFLINVTVISRYQIIWFFYFPLDSSHMEELRNECTHTDNIKLPTICFLPYHILKS